MVVLVVAADGVAQLQEQEHQAKVIMEVQEMETQVHHNPQEVAAAQVVQEVLTLHQVPQEAQVVQV